MFAASLTAAARCSSCAPATGPSGSSGSDVFDSLNFGPIHATAASTMWNFSLDAMALGCFKRRKVAGILLLFLLLSFPAAASETTPVINSVALLGTMLPVNLTAQAGQPYDASSIRKDVRALWSTGRFEDIRVETAQSAGRVSIIFRVTEATQWQLHEIRIEPSTHGLHPKQAEGTPVNRFRAHEIALEARNQLNAEGYLHARVDEKL